MRKQPDEEGRLRREIKVPSLPEWGNKIIQILDKLKQTGLSSEDLEGVLTELTEFICEGIIHASKSGMDPEATPEELEKVLPPELLDLLENFDNLPIEAQSKLAEELANNLTLPEYYFAVSIAPSSLHAAVWPKWYLNLVKLMQSMPKPEGFTIGNPQQRGEDNQKGDISYNPFDSPLGMAGQVDEDAADDLLKKYLL